MVEMQTLRAPPFNLLNGDSIVARGAGKNAVGRGVVSEMSDQGTLVMQRPRKMKAPALEDDSSNRQGPLLDAK